MKPNAFCTYEPKHAPRSLLTGRHSVSEGMDKLVLGACAGAAITSILMEFFVCKSLRKEVALAKREQEILETHLIMEKENREVSGLPRPALCPVKRQTLCALFRGCRKEFAGRHFTVFHATRLFSGPDRRA